jgi:hypothetical protein
MLLGDFGCRYTFSPQLYPFDRDVGGEHERLANGDAVNDVSLAACADICRLSRFRPTSEHRLVDCPLDALKEHQEPTTIATAMAVR